MNLYQYAPNPLSWIDPWGWAKCGGGNKESTKRMRHYTNRAGSTGIERDGVIKARDNNRVYLEPASKKPLSRRDAERLHKIDKGRGRDYIETDVPTSKIEMTKNPRTGVLEHTVKGDLPLNNAKTTKRK